jgi:hypothetical protein
MTFFAAAMAASLSSNTSFRLAQPAQVTPKTHLSWVASVGQEQIRWWVVWSAYQRSRAFSASRYSTSSHRPWTFSPAMNRASPGV